MIVCFDTNVWVSAVATRGLCTDVVSAALAEHQVVVGATILAELRRVLRDKLRIPRATIREMEAFLRMHAIVIPAAKPIDFAGIDEADRKALAEAAAGRADVFVTGDQDLLRIGGRLPFRVVSPRGFWERLRSG